MTGETSVESTIPASRSELESRAWSQFSAADSSDAFWLHWLNILCLKIDAVQAGCVLLQAESDESFGVGAVWPDTNRDIQYLAGTAETALSERRGVVLSADDGGPPKGSVDAFAGYPVIVAGEVKAAVVLHLAPRAAQELQQALRQIHWSSAWLSNRFFQDALAERKLELERLAVITDITAIVMDNEGSGQSALAMSNELVAILDCARVSVGFEVAGSIELKAISGTANFDKKMAMVGLLTNAMDEVLDLAVSLEYPTQDDGLDVLAHIKLAEGAEVSSVLSVPLIHQGRVTGVLTLERKAGTFTQADRILSETLGLLLGPLFTLKFHDEQGLLQRARIALHSGIVALFGPRHPGLKLSAILLVSVLAFLSLASSGYKVSADTVIEGAVQRAIVAPFEGYIVESLIRAGDTVEEGQVLSRLDDKDLRLEQIKWSSERLQLLGRQRQAMAEQNNVDTAIIGAQIRQVDAQINLVNERLSRSVLLAPFDGVVVSGDLSQLLGTPVAQGDVLFEVALLDAYRVILKIDERDIAQMELGQNGQLAMYSLPDEVIPFVVKQITPVSIPEGGRNYFRIEAEISTGATRLRPGMEGVGKVEIGERKLIWIWTHRFVDWLRLWVWNWEP